MLVGAAALSSGTGTSEGSTVEQRAPWSPAAAESTEAMVQTRSGAGAVAEAPSVRDVRSYKVSHYAKVSIEEEGWQRLEEWMEEHSIQFGGLGDDVFSVDVADVQLTPSHFAALNGGEDERFDLDEFCSTLFSDEDPSWLEEGESVGSFEVEHRIGMGPLDKWCGEQDGAASGPEAARVLCSELRELLGEIVEGGGMTDSVWIEDASKYS
jgi:hypothetical protein